MHCEITPQPVRVGPASIALTLATQSGAPVSGASVKIEGDMTHPGMGPVFAQAEAAGPGKYAGTLDFTMPGDWVVSVQASLPGGARFERRINVRGVAPR
ncbi:MAG TPA: FixH family protein [Bryobacteraceae bacterium]|jgi:hypothetical protein|nr:FixH family protein [Bryobacteraceae bacterium]